MAPIRTTGGIECFACPTRRTGQAARGPAGLRLRGADRRDRALRVAGARGRPPRLYAGRSAETRAPIGWIEFCTQYPRECAGGPSDAARRRALSAGVARPRAGQHLGQQRDQADHRPRSLGRGREVVLSGRRLRRLRGLRAAQAPHADAGRLAARGAAHHGGARQARTKATPCSPSRPTRATSSSTTRPRTSCCWSDTGYRFVKRQSQSDPNVWVSLGDPRPATATATAHRATH